VIAHLWSPYVLANTTSSRLLKLVSVEVRLALADISFIELGGALYTAVGIQIFETGVGSSSNVDWRDTGGEIDFGGVVADQDGVTIQLEESGGHSGAGKGKGEEKRIEVHIAYNIRE
jgi:hypothetical protein